MVSWPAPMAVIQVISPEIIRAHSHSRVYTSSREAVNGIPVRPSMNLAVERWDTFRANHHSKT